MPRSEFWEDLRDGIHERTTTVLTDGNRDFTEKVRLLGEISAHKINFEPASVQTTVEQSAAKDRVVAALVTCPVVPWFDSIFIGRLAGEEPLRLTGNGLFLTAGPGVVVRAFMRNDGHNYRFGPTSRYDDEVVPTIDGTELRVLSNKLIPAHFSPSPMTETADRVLAGIDGLDFKIVHEGINLPGVGADVGIAETYDRMGLVRFLGQSAYSDIFATLGKPAPAI